MQLLPYKNEFLINLRANNYSPRTVKNYDRDLAYFEAFLEIENIQFKSLKKIHITLFKSIVRTDQHIRLLGLVDKYWSVSNSNVKKLEKSEFEEENLEVQKIEDVNTPVKILKEFKVPHSSISQEDNYRLTEGSKNSTNDSPEHKYNYASQNGSTVQALSTSSINRMLSAFRSYLKFLEEFDYFPPLSSDTVKLLKKEKKESQIAEYEELIKLIEAPSELEKKDEIAFRNRAMLELLFSTGMRISELLSLNREQLTLGKNDDKNPVQVSRIYILGKGKKQRFVYLTPRAKTHLENYLKFRDDKNPGLFIQYKNKRLGQISEKKNYRIKSSYLQKKIIQYRKQLGIIVPTSAHSLRHGFATYLIEKGANTAAVQILLGHESLATTTRYVHASDKFAEKTHKDFHPLSG